MHRFVDQSDRASAFELVSHGRQVGRGRRRRQGLFDWAGHPLQPFGLDHLAQAHRAVPSEMGEGTSGRPLSRLRALERPAWAAEAVPWVTKRLA